MADESTIPATASRQRKTARALRLGRRLKIAGLVSGNPDQDTAVLTSPLILRVGDGFAALFPFGTVVLIEISQAEEEALLRRLNDRVAKRLDTPTIAFSEIEIGTGNTISPDLIMVQDLSPLRLVVVAEALARNVALTFEEAEVRKVFEVLEPFADDLASFGRLPWNRRRMLRTVGHALQIHQRLFDRTALEESPALLSYDADVERLRERLVEVFHFDVRDQALSRRLEAIEIMTSALTEMLDAQRGIRLETMIVLLIVFEITITFYDLFLRAG